MNNLITLTKLNEMIQQFYNEISELSLKQLSELLIQRNRDRISYCEQCFCPSDFTPESVSYVLKCLRTQYLLDRMLAVGYDIIGLWSESESDDDLFYVVCEDSLYAYAFHVNTDCTDIVEFVRIKKKDVSFDVLVSNEDEIRVSLYDLLIELRTDTIHVIDDFDVPFYEYEEWDEEYDEEWYED